MKVFGVFLALLFTFTGCQKDEAPLSIIHDQVLFYTNKIVYHQNETIILTLENNLDQPIHIPVLGSCIYFDHYQRFVNGKWKNEGYDMRMLPIRAKVLNPGSSKIDTISTERFGRTGIFRIPLDYWDDKGNKTVYSNSFEIY